MTGFAAKPGTAYTPKPLPALFDTMLEVYYALREADATLALLADHYTGKSREAIDATRRRTSAAIAAAKNGAT